MLSQSLFKVSTTSFHTDSKSFSEAQNGRVDRALRQHGAPAHTTKLAQDWIATNCNDFIGKDDWPLNSQDLNPLD